MEFAYSSGSGKKTALCPSIFTAELYDEAYAYLEKVFSLLRGFQ